MPSKLTFVFSSMNSGKSLALLTKNFMLKEKGFRTMLMKPALDDRTETISSRLGLEEKCFILYADESATQILKEQTGYEYRNGMIHYILVDEAQFLTKDQVWDLAGLVDDHNINVICYGLKLNWQGEFFEGSHELMKIADELIQTETFCKENQGAPALFHIKLSGSKSAVETGYEDMYDTASRKKWQVWWESQNEKTN